MAICVLDAYSCYQVTPFMTSAIVHAFMNRDLNLRRWLLIMTMGLILLSTAFFIKSPLRIGLMSKDFKLLKDIKTLINISGETKKLRYLLLSCWGPMQWYMLVDGMPGQHISDSDSYLRWHGNTIFSWVTMWVSSLQQSRQDFSSKYFCLWSCSFSLQLLCGS